LLLWIALIVSTMLHFQPFFDPRTFFHRTCAFCEGFILSSCASKKSTVWQSLIFYSNSNIPTIFIDVVGFQTPAPYNMHVMLSRGSYTLTLFFSYIYVCPPHAASSYVLNRVCVCFCVAVLQWARPPRSNLWLFYLLCWPRSASPLYKVSRHQNFPHARIPLTAPTGQSHLVQIRRGSVNRR
jgi:hypothetical protein